MRKSRSFSRISLGLAAILAMAATAPGDEPKAKAKKADPLQPARDRMVQRHLAERGIKDPKVLEAFRTVPRHLFVPPEARRLSYEDESIPIGEKQTITPPYDVAFMTESLHLKPTDRVYEVGTGSGYQASILSRIAKEVYSVEIHAPLSERATKLIKELGYNNVHTRVGDGYEGWPDAAPFDAVIVTCAPEKIPPPLVAQLKEGGRMVIPLGDRFNQAVYYYEKHNGKLTKPEKLLPTLFVPMTGRAQREAAEERAKKAKASKDKGAKP
ncbi:MAG TPA: protein-L-isoaspartate(D-aspartate) O-methyltransferase [Isosphaeraceae bacterium]|jgi:protein-L-isoaspartate(D-aspartate) O-methyltransferase|nr:protein-L-isoaspartate(D-aspartate) O-methyltransferase [Isosphaeraceae bacterium]